MNSYFFVKCISEHSYIGISLKSNGHVSGNLIFHLPVESMVYLQVTYISQQLCKWQFISIPLQNEYCTVLELFLSYISHKAITLIQLIEAEWRIYASVD